MVTKKYPRHRRTRHTRGQKTKIFDTCIAVVRIHESRNLKQARPEGQYVDLLRGFPAHATPSRKYPRHHSIMRKFCQ